MATPTSQPRAVVIGAGFVGTSIALQLQRRGWQVTLMDKTGPAGGASFGNAGVLQKEAVAPYAFPRALSRVLDIVLRRGIAIRYHPTALPGFAEALFRFWRNSAPAAHAGSTRAYSTLITQALVTHAEQIDWAGESAANLIRRDGWFDLYRSDAGLAAGLAAARRNQEGYGVSFGHLDGDAVAALEPNLTERFRGALHWNDTWTVRDPGKLNEAYADAFVAAGGTMLKAQLARLERRADMWEIRDPSGAVVANAPQAVLATGAWSGTLTRQLGYRIPFFVKRGYHRHFQPCPDKPLNNWIADLETGFLLAPMQRGIRLTTGAEVGRIDAPKTPIQITRAEEIARAMFPLGARVEDDPWMGGRPCVSDMLPVIGPAGRDDGLWFAFGHGHQGLTMGAATGRLVAEMMSGKTPFVDPAPFLPTRFASP